MATEVLHAATPCPELWPELWPVVLSHDELGRDANGGLLLTEVRAYLDDPRRGVIGEGARAAYRRLWRAIDSEAARHFARSLPKAQKDD